MKNCLEFFEQSFVPLELGHQKMNGLWYHMVFSLPFSDVSAFHCKALSRPLWGSMKCLPSDSGPFHSGSSCEFSCDQGFELKGSKRLQCGPRGEWDSKKPTCSGIFSLEILFLCLLPSLSSFSTISSMCGDQRPTCRSRFSPYVWVPEMKFRLWGLAASAFPCRAILLAPCDIL